MSRKMRFKKESFSIIIVGPSVVGSSYLKIKAYHDCPLISRLFLGTF